MHPTVIITGANGFIGSFLVDHFSKKEWQVKAFARKPIEQKSPLVQYYPFEMPDKIDEDVFSGVDFLIHCAVAKYSVKLSNSDEINIQGTQKLLDLSRKYNLKKFVFFSTMSAHEQAKSHYGKHKLHLESIFDLTQEVVLKPGLVLGDGGLFSTIKNTIQKSRVIPLVDGGKQPIQTIYIGQLAQVIELILEQSLSGCFYLGEPTSITLKQLYQAIATSLGTKKRFAYAPSVLVGMALKTLAFLRIQTEITNENLLGLKALKPFDTTESSQQLNIDFKTYEESLQELFLKK